MTNEDFRIDFEELAKELGYEVTILGSIDGYYSYKSELTNVAWEFYQIGYDYGVSQDD